MAKVSANTQIPLDVELRAIASFYDDEGGFAHSDDEVRFYGMTHSKKGEPKEVEFKMLASDVMSHIASEMQLVRRRLKREGIRLQHDVIMHEGRNVPVTYILTATGAIGKKYGRSTQPMATLELDSKNVLSVMQRNQRMLTRFLKI